MLGLPAAPSYLILTDEFLVGDVGRQIRVQQGTESQAVAPAAAEVGHINILLTDNIHLRIFPHYETKTKPQNKVTKKLKVKSYRVLKIGLRCL